MLIGFEVTSARPKRENEDDPFQESMRGDRKLLSNPSTDQKKIRRRQQKTADLTAEGVREWYTKRRRATAPSQDEEFDHDDKACPTCGYHPTTKTAFQERMAAVTRKEN